MNLKQNSKNVQFVIDVEVKDMVQIEKTRGKLNILLTRSKSAYEVILFEGDL